MNYEQRIKIHFMGIGGSGASAVAAIASSYGFQISGCDIAKSKYLAPLEKIDISIGHNKDHLKNCQMLVITPAISKFDPKNEEVVFAKKLKIPVLTWQEFMGKFLQKGKRVIAVSGTHGKSTTTAMIGHILEDAGFDPTVEIGAIDLSWEKNFRLGQGIFFVCEADEYNDNFLNYKPEIGVITNIEFDHPDFFENEEQVFASFKKFIKNNDNLESLFLAPDEVGIRKFLVKLLSKKKAVRYLELIKSGQKKFNLKLAGSHNSTNANLAAAVAGRLGISEKLTKKSLENFEGLERRLEFIGTIGKTKIFDDFAHHQTEIEATLKTLKKQFPAAKTCLIFQPHTYSRTYALFSDFVKVFRKTHLSQIILTDIFASREKNDLGVSSHDLAAVVGKKTIYISNLAGVVDWVRRNFSKFNLILTAGAGDIGKIWDFENLKVKLRHAGK